MVFLLGLVLATGGETLAVTNHPNWATLLTSVGCSLIAAALVTYLSPASVEVFQKFMDLGVSNLWSSRGDIPPTHWVAWVRQAHERFTEIGISNNGWCRDHAFPEAVKHRLRQGVTVKMFFLNPMTELARVRATEDTGRNTIQTIKISIKRMWDIRESIEEEAIKQNFHLFVYAQTPSFGATWIDDFMIVTHYLPGFANLTSPALLVKPVSTTEEVTDLYRVYADNCKMIEQAAIEITTENIAQYIEGATDAGPV